MGGEQFAAKRAVEALDVGIFLAAALLKRRKYYNKLLFAATIF